MQVARWSLICAALLAGFQGWLWVGQGSLVALAAAISLAVALVIVASLSGSRFAVMLNREWALSRKADEPERRYRFRVAIAWALVVGTCVVGALLVRGTTVSFTGGIVLRVFGFVALLMGLQALLVELFRTANAAPRAAKP